MSTPQHKGKIKNVGYNGGYYYDRVAPGVSFPTDYRSSEEIARMSSAVITYKLERKEEKTF